MVVPLRATESRRYFFDRALSLIDRWRHHDAVELLVVDSGSDAHLAAAIEARCFARGVSFVRDDSQHEVYAVGRARDIGAQHARGDVVMFQDVDLVVRGAFYDDVLREIAIREMRHTPTEFFCIPCIYLTESATTSLSGTDLDDIALWRIQQSMLEGDSRVVLSFAPATSTFVVHRRHYLACGGHNREFYGHGYEDFELFHRLAAHSRTFVRPDAYYLDKKTYDSVEFEGFRAFFSLFGRAAFARSLFTVHLWHPREAGTPYDARRAQNRVLVERCMRAFDRDGTQPLPLSDLATDTRTLVLGIEGDRGVLAIREALPYLGRIFYRSELAFRDADDLSRFIESRNINRVLFFNPYGNEVRRALYDHCRVARIPYLVFERGGLTDSWFFDSNGFNADSRTYRSEAWDQPLSDAQRASIIEYVTEELRADTALEKNGPRRGAATLRANLRIGDRKVLFVPFQRPRDTVTRFFSGWVDGVAGFSDFVADVARTLDPNEWVILAKKHPLERERPQVPGVTFLDDSTHFLDAITLCDAVLLMNSGVGLYALMAGKPLLRTSQSYYDDPSLSTLVESVDDVRSALLRPKVDYEARLRFLYHLRFRVYSFGTATTQPRVEPDGSLTTITTAITFRELRGVVDTDRWFSSRARPLDAMAPLYERYRASIARRRKAASAASQGTPAPKHPLPAASASPKPVPCTSSTPVVTAARPVRAAASPAEPRSDSRLSRKLRKLRRDPHRFLADSQNDWLRRAGAVLDRHNLTGRARALLEGVLRVEDDG